MSVTPSFEPVAWPDDAEAAVAFLTGDGWPFHSTPHLGADEADEIEIAGDDIASFWIRVDGSNVGLIRVFDLDDVETGSPLFDLRITASYRGRGLGVIAVRWLTDHLFSSYEPLHRIEATTRDDNLAMQAVFSRCGYRLEGRFVEAWLNDDGSRADSLAYAILRREWAVSSDDTA